VTPRAIYPSINFQSRERDALLLHINKFFTLSPQRAERWLATNTKCIQAGNQLYTNTHIYSKKCTHGYGIFLFFPPESRLPCCKRLFANSRSHGARLCMRVSLCARRRGVSIYILMVIDTLFCASCLRHIFTHRPNRCGGFQRTAFCSESVFKHTQSSLGLISCQLKLTRRRGGNVAGCARLETKFAWRRRGSRVESCGLFKMFFIWPNPRVCAQPPQQCPWQGKSVRR
jgi:hypothetical protein